MATSLPTNGLRTLAELNERDLLPIVRAVCRAHGVTLEELCGPVRSRSVYRARHEAWWRVWSHPERHYSHSDLGRIFGRNPDTIRQGIQAHLRRLTAPSDPSSRRIHRAGGRRG